MVLGFSPIGETIAGRLRQDASQVKPGSFEPFDPALIRRASEARAASAPLLKVNQIGTLPEAAEACSLAREAGWNVTISARSGETEDNLLADLAVGWAGDQIKIGSITQSDRLAKYNRLLAIEAETRLPLVPWPGKQAAREARAGRASGLQDAGAPAPKFSLVCRPGMR